MILYYKNLQFKQLIYHIAINLYSSLNFVSMEGIRRKCDPMVDLLL